MALHDFEITEDSIKMDGKDFFATKLQLTMLPNEIPRIEMGTYAESIATKIEGELYLDITTYTDREMVEFGEIVSRNTVRGNPTSDIEFAEMGMGIVARFVEMFKSE